MALSSFSSLLSIAVLFAFFDVDAFDGIPRDDDCYLASFPNQVFHLRLGVNLLIGNHLVFGRLLRNADGEFVFYLNSPFREGDIALLTILEKKRVL